MEKIKKIFDASYLEFKRTLHEYETHFGNSQSLITYLKAFLKSYEVFIEDLVGYMVQKFHQKYNEKVPEKSSNMEKVKFIHERVNFNKKEFNTLKELIRLRNETVHEYNDISSEEKKQQTIENIKNKISKFDYLFDNQQRALVVKKVDKMLPALKKIDNKNIKEDNILPISLKNVAEILTIGGIIGIGLGATALGVAAVIKKFTEKK